MSWFRLDDNSDTNAKVIAAGNAAWGLFCRCGAWSTKNLTDGHIPAHIATLYGTRGEISALVKARLWTVDDDPHGPGWKMPDFLEFNRSRTAVLAERAAATARQRRGRDTQRSQRDDPDSDGPVTGLSHRDNGVSHGDVTVVGVTVVPTRPDPTPSHTSSDDDDFSRTGHPSSSSIWTTDPTLAAAVELIARAVTIAAAPRKPRSYERATFQQLIAENRTAIADRLTAGATPFALAAEWAGGDAYAHRAARELHVAEATP